MNFSLVLRAVIYYYKISREDSLTMQHLCLILIHMIDIKFAPLLFEIGFWISYEDSLDKWASILYLYLFIFPSVFQWNMYFVALLYKTLSVFWYYDFRRFALIKIRCFTYKIFLGSPWFLLAQHNFYRVSTNMWKVSRYIIMNRGCPQTC